MRGLRHGRSESSAEATRSSAEATRSFAEATRSFAEDTRARVPFALIGVLLLVTSSAYAAGVVDQGLVSQDRSVERAAERVDADTTSALKTAAREAAHDAAVRPVTRAPTEGDDGAGAEATDAVRPGSAFEDAFRIRLALAGADALSAVDATVGGVSASVSTEPSLDPDDPTDLEAHRESVSVGPVANGTATRVVFEDVTTTATRDGRIVAERTRDRTVVVAVPTLAAHERTERFEERLNHGPVEGPGLGRQITASLYPITWARGYAQYAGAPVQNVLANRHVELSTNAGIVRTQRDVFGASDPEARGGVAEATARTGMTDLLAPAALDETSWTDAVLDTPTPGGERGGDGFGAAANHTDETTTVEVGHAADVAAVSTHEGLASTVRDGYRVEAGVETSAERTVWGGTPRPDPPGSGDWARADREVDERIRVVPDDAVPRGVPSGTVEVGEERGFGTATRTVSVERTATETWERTIVSEGPDGGLRTRTVERTTAASVTDRYRVVVRASGAYGPAGDAPGRPVATFGAGGTSDGPDLTGTPEAARAKLGVDTASGVDRIARETVEDGRVTRSTVVFGHRSEATIDRIGVDLDGLRAEVRGIETDLSMEATAVGEAEPHGDLADEVRDRRGALVNPPATYDGAAERARIAVRVAYLDAVLAELEAAADDNEAATGGLLDRVDTTFDGPSVGETIAEREAARDVETHHVGEGGPGGSVTFVPNGSPGYLPRTAVDGSDAAAVADAETTRPLDTRNINYVTVPYGDVADGIVERILGGEDTVRIGVAGRALVAADELPATRENPDLRADRKRLANRVEASRATVDRELVLALDERTSLTRRERESVVGSIGATYPSTGTRAVAIGSGEYAERIAAEAARIGSLSDGTEAALAARLRVALRTAAGRDAVRVPTRFVDGPTGAVRKGVRNEISGAIEDGGKRAGKEAAERWTPKPVRSVGAGLPVAPVPGYWIATVNAWRVAVRGEYPRFALTADVGPPEQPFEYVREEGTVTVRAGDDRVRLGATEPVRFETGTVIVVAVPPKPPGVGDVDGTRNETSAGW